MKKSLLNICIILLILFFSSCSNTKNDDKANEKPQTDQTQMNNNQEERPGSDLVREGVIDLVSIDENKDDSLYECPMDWNVISDNAGDCPSCGMKLKKHSIAEVQSNLAKYGYEYKQ